MIITEMFHRRRTALWPVLLAGVFAMFCWSCEKDEIRAVATDGVAGTFTSSATDLPLSLEKAETPAVKFTWEPADFGYQAAVSYVLQLGIKGDNFETVKEVAVPAGQFEVSYTHHEFNAQVLALNLEIGEAASVEARIKSSVSSALSAVYSNIQEMQVTPYASISYLYVPGAYQGWDPATAESLISPTSNGIYEGVILFSAGNLEFKVTTARSWENAYGLTGEGKVGLNEGENIKAPAAGSYLLTVNTNTNTIVMKPLVWGIIGDATPGGWDTDTDMQYNNAEGVWSVTATMKAGAFKFRKDHDWGANLGGSNGTLTDGGDNISVAAAGTYTITLDLSGYTYSISKQ